MPTHIVQSSEWGEFKTKYGTPSVRVGNVQYTKHKIPFSNFYYAYCPRVNPFDIDFEALKKSAVANNCININFDVPNVIADSEEAPKAVEILEKNCQKAPRDQFAKGNVVLDISGAEDEIMAKMHNKHRYNIKYAARNGVTIRQAEKPEDFELFYKLYAETAERQKYYGRAHLYLKDLWDIFYPAKIAHIIIGEYNGVALASWLLMAYEEVLYYPYGGSSEQYKNLFGSSLVAWESIKLGKSLGCKSFDMWGTSVDPNDTADSYYGFTNFKLRFGGKHVVYIDSYDLVLNEHIYSMFNSANNLRWKLLKILK